MRNVRKIFDRLRNDHGASAVEYGLLVSLIAAAIVTLVGVLGGKVGSAFQAIVNVLPN
jgi:pilus assembly protein Flp/PilA